MFFSPLQRQGSAGHDYIADNNCLFFYSLKSAGDRDACLCQWGGVNVHRLPIQPLYSYLYLYSISEFYICICIDIQPLYLYLYLHLIVTRVYVNGLALMSRDCLFKP